MATYRCEIGGWMRRVRAESPELAAARATRLYQRTHVHFACDAEPAVLVDGVEYVPEAYACEDDLHVYDAGD